MKWCKGRDIFTVIHNLSTCWTPNLKFNSCKLNCFYLTHNLIENESRNNLVKISSFKVSNTFIIANVGNFSFCESFLFELFQKINPYEVYKIYSYVYETWFNPPFYKACVCVCVCVRVCVCVCVPAWTGLCGLEWVSFHPCGDTPVCGS